MEFSKSESSKMSRVPSTRAAEAACKTSRPPLKDFGKVFGGRASAVEEEFEGGGSGGIGSGSPRSMKTSQTRSWAGKGME